MCQVLKQRSIRAITKLIYKVGGQAVLGRQDASPTPWLTERHGYDPTSHLYTTFNLCFKTSLKP